MKNWILFFCILWISNPTIYAQDATYEELIAEAEAAKDNESLWKEKIDKAIKMAPNKPDAYYSQYYLQKDLSKDSTKAVGALLKGIKFDKLAPRKAYYQGVFFIDHRNKPDSSLFFFGKAMSALKEKDLPKKKCPIYFGLAKSYYKKNDSKSAREQVSQWMKLMENLNCEECASEMGALVNMMTQEETRLKSPDYPAKLFFKEAICNEYMIKNGGFDVNFNLLWSLSYVKNPGSAKLSWALISKCYAYVLYAQEFKNLGEKDEDRKLVYQSFFQVAPIFEKDENSVGENISYDILYNAFPEQVVSFAQYLNSKSEPEKAMEYLEKSAELSILLKDGGYYYERAKTRKMMAGDVIEVCMDYKKSKEYKFKPAKDELKAVCK